MKHPLERNGVQHNSMCQFLSTPYGMAEPRPCDCGAEIKPLITALKTYKQADADGVTVLVSRQACDEAAEMIASLDSGCDRALTDVVRLRVAIQDALDGPDEDIRQHLNAALKR